MTSNMTAKIQTNKW